MTTLTLSLFPYEIYPPLPLVEPDEMPTLLALAILLESSCNKDDYFWSDCISLFLI